MTDVMTKAALKAAIPHPKRKNGTPNGSVGCRIPKGPLADLVRARVAKDGKTITEVICEALVASVPG
jgi:hypothetical protein